MLKNVKYLFTLEVVVSFEISMCSKFFSRSVYFFCNKYSMTLMKVSCVTIDSLISH